MLTLNWTSGSTAQGQREGQGPLWHRRIGRWGSEGPGQKGSHPGHLQGQVGRADSGLQQEENPWLTNSPVLGNPKWQQSTSSDPGK